MFAYSLLALSAAIAAQSDPAAETAEPVSVPAELFDRPVPPRGDIPGLFRADDYPQEAILKNEQGSTQVVLLLDESGQVSDCSIGTSSGSATLDAKTCEVITMRARFEPARDQKGRPVVSAIRQRIVWRLMEAESVIIPAKPWHMRFTVLLGPNGEHRSCSAELTSLLPNVDEPCAGAILIPAEIAARISQGTEADTSVVTLERWLAESGSDLPEGEGAGELLSRHVSQVTIGPDGRISDCRETEARGPFAAHIDLCASVRQYQFEPPVDEAENPAELQMKIVNLIRVRGEETATTP